MGDTYLAFLRHVLVNRPWRLINCWSLPIQVVLYALSLRSSDSLKISFLHAVAGGCSRVAMAGLVDDFVSQYCRSNLKEQALACLARHRAQGDRIILATASLDLYAVPLGATIGVDDVLSTRAAWSGDLLTGELNGPNLKGEQKLVALKSLLANRADVPHPDVAYSDHHSDIPLLAFAILGVAVDPTRKLRRVAPLRGFQVQAWT